MKTSKNPSTITLLQEPLFSVSLSEIVFTSSLPPMPLPFKVSKNAENNEIYIFDEKTLILSHLVFFEVFDELKERVRRLIRMASKNTKMSSKYGAIYTPNIPENNEFDDSSSYKINQKVTQASTQHTSKIWRDLDVFCMLAGDCDDGWRAKVVAVKSVCDIEELKRQARITIIAMKTHKNGTMGWYYLMEIVKKAEELIGNKIGDFWKDLVVLQLVPLIEMKPKSYKAWEFIAKSILFLLDSQEDLRPEVLTWSYKTVRKLAEQHIRNYSPFHLLGIIIREIGTESIDSHLEWVHNLKGRMVSFGENPESLECINTHIDAVREEFK